MEQSIAYLKQQFALGEVDIRTFSPLTLAYIGDAAYELVIRTVLVLGGNRSVNSFHRSASSLVKASAQSQMMDVIKPFLTEEELYVYRRGRNAHPATTAKNASVGDYHRATGFEAVMGYLYLKEEWFRMIDLVKTGIENGVEKR